MQRFVSDSPAATQELARRLGRICPETMLFLLAGDLGSGKTCFVQGLAEGLGLVDDEPVSSPTYALMNHYRGRVDIYHFDLYRLGGSGELDELGFDDIFAGPGVKVVEWPGVLPLADEDGVRIDFTYGDQPEERVLALSPLGPVGMELLAAIAEEGSGP